MVSHAHPYDDETFTFTDIEMTQMQIERAQRAAGVQRLLFL
jgi:hypothetical protein